MSFLKINIFRRGIRYIAAVLCDLVYWLIAKLYELFITIARLNILTSDHVAPIYQRVTMILTIVMAFYITFEFVKFAIEPDTITDKEKGAGNILKRIVIVVVLIAFVPEIFSLAFKLQSRVIETQLISKVILGTKNTNYTKYGYDFSANMLEQFYYYDTETCGQAIADCKEAYTAVNTNLNELRNKGTINIHSSINLESGTDHYKETEPAIKFTFDGILALGVGIFIAYILIMYSIDLGARYAQLLYLQVIAPIAIMGYILPKKDGIFQKWVRQCTTTYIDLFIRIAIINFVLLLTKVIGEGLSSNNMFADVGEVGLGLKSFVYVALVMGLLTFAKRVPKLIAELFPSMGSASIGFGLGAKDRISPTKDLLGGVRDTVGTGRRVVGGVTGAIVGGVAGRGIRGAIEGAKTGADKNKKGLLGGSVISRTKEAGYAGGAIREQREDIKDAGGTVFGSEHRAGHYKNLAQEQDRKVGTLEAMASKKKDVSNAANDVKFMQQMATMQQSIEKANPSAGKDWIQVMKKAEGLERKYADGRISAVELQSGVNNLITDFNTKYRSAGVQASTISTGSVADQLKANATKIKTNDKYAEAEWNRVMEQAQRSLESLNAGHITNAAYEAEVNRLITNYNSSIDTHYASDAALRAKLKVNATLTADGSNDFEIGTAKHTVVRTALDEARKVAQAINGQKYKMEDGTEKTITYNADTFTDDIGDITNGAQAAAQQEKVKDEYKRAHANAKGAGNK